MKAIIEFNLPEDTEAYEAAIAGYKYKQTLDIIMADDSAPFTSVKEIQEFIKDNLNEYE